MMRELQRFRIRERCLLLQTHCTAVKIVKKILLLK